MHDEYHDRHDPQYVNHEVDVEAVILIVRLKTAATQPEPAVLTTAATAYVTVNSCTVTVAWLNAMNWMVVENIRVRHSA